MTQDFPVVLQPGWPKQDSAAQSPSRIPSPLNASKFSFHVVGVEARNAGPPKTAPGGLAINLAIGGLGGRKNRPFARAFGCISAGTDKSAAPANGGAFPRTGRGPRSRERAAPASPPSASIANAGPVPGYFPAPKCELCSRHAGGPLRPGPWSKAPRRRWPTSRSLLRPARPTSRLEPRDRRHKQRDDDGEGRACPTLATPPVQPTAATAGSRLSIAARDRWRSERPNRDQEGGGGGGGGGEKGSPIACCRCPPRRPNGLAAGFPRCGAPWIEALAPFAADGAVEEIVEARAQINRARRRRGIVAGGRIRGQ